MMTDDLIELLQVLDSRQAHYARLDKYFEGKSPLSFLSRESKIALRNFDQISSNLCRTCIISLQERLRLAGVSGSDAWDLFRYSDLDQIASKSHADALLYGVSWILCWTDRRGKPRATVESPKSVAVVRDPVTREILRAVKRVRTKDATLAWVYYADRVEKWVANTPSAGNAGFVLMDTVPNGLGIVPVIAIGHEDEQSVIADLLTIQDSINKLLHDMMIASEYAGMPRRFATGIILKPTPVIDEDTGEPVIDEETGEPVMTQVTPFPLENRMMTSEDPQSKFGAIPAADLSQFADGIRILISQAQMVSGLPSHYVGAIQDSVTSADSLRASEQALVARVEAFQRAYGIGWEGVARALVGIRDGVDPDTVIARIQWAPADTRSQAQEADYAQKLYASNLMSKETLLRKLGFSEDEIEAELDAIDRGFVRETNKLVAAAKTPTYK